MSSWFLFVLLGAILWGVWDNQTRLIKIQKQLDQIARLK